MSITKPSSRRHSPHTDQTEESSLHQDGLVIVNYGKSLLVEDKAGKLHRCVARRELEQLVCGDRVTWQPTSDLEGVVEILKPRRTVLNRTTGVNRSQPLAANIDQIVVVAAVKPALDSFLIDKYTAAAELAGATPLIVINKSDLLGPEEKDKVSALLEEYQALAYKGLIISTLQDSGIDAFAAGLADKTSILVGQSGVGKSSLIKRVLPEIDITTGRLSEASGLGKHTTTATTLYHLPRGGQLIDSPGVRDFRLEPSAADRLVAGFPEFTPLSGRCQFHNCRHLTEPRCAVADAAESGEISPRRLESYRRILQQLGD